MIVTVGGWTLELLHRDGNKDGAEVYFSSGTQIGYVFKSSYTYSPPIYKGSRIAREHRSVKCWAIEAGSSGFESKLSKGIGSDRCSHSHFRTRRDALERLLREHFERGEEEAKVIAFAKSHPEARFRIPNVNGTVVVGEVIRPHPGGLHVRRAGVADVKVRRRAMQEDRGAILEVQLRPRGRWEAVANAMYEDREGAK